MGMNGLNGLKFRLAKRTNGHIKVRRFELYIKNKL